MLGIHIIADLYGVRADLIDAEEKIRNLMEDTVRYSKLTKISSHTYQFVPHGASGVVLLAESHLSIHTWPEYGVATVDVFTCGEPSGAYTAIEYVIESLSPSRVNINIMDRGNLLYNQSLANSVLSWFTVKS